MRIPESGTVDERRHKWIKFPINLSFQKIKYKVNVLPGHWYHGSELRLRLFPDAEAVLCVLDNETGYRRMAAGALDVVCKHEPVIKILKLYIVIIIQEHGLCNNLRTLCGARLCGVVRSVYPALDRYPKHFFKIKNMVATNYKNYMNVFLFYTKKRPDRVYS